MSLSENLFKKLNIQPGDRVLLINPPEGMRNLLEANAPPGVEFSLQNTGEVFDGILLWPNTLSGLDAHLTELAYRILSKGAIWLVIPKKKFAPARGIHFTWLEMQQTALNTDLVDNKEVSFSETDYATRFVIRKEYRHKYQ